MGTGERPLVTVLLPVFNGERHLAAAIRSILDQTYTAFELIVLDDGSTDASAAIAESVGDPRIRVVRLSPQVGLSRALNEGLSMARGPLVARQDADDLSEPRRLERQVAALEARPDLALIGCQAWLIDSDGRIIGTVDRCLEPLTVRWYGLLDNPFIHTAVMFRAAIIRDELGGYDAAFDPYSQDFSLWSRLLDRHPAANLKERLVRYRSSAESVIGAVHADPAAAYAQRFDAIVRRIVVDALTRMFGGELTDAEKATLAGFGVSIDVASIDAFIAAFARLMRLFETRYPAIMATDDFWRVLARQFNAVAYRISPPSRIGAVKVYAAGLRIAPRAGIRISWPRALAQIVLGKPGREWLSKVRPSSTRVARMGLR